MLGRCQEQVNAHLSRGESYRASAEACFASSIYRTTAPITSTNRDTSHCTNNWHFRAIAYPYPRAENACAKEASWGRRGQPAWQYPSTTTTPLHTRPSHIGPRFYLARSIRRNAAPQITRQSRAYKAATGTRSTDRFAGASASRATPMTTSAADPTKNPTF
jgi:hypothetical protein